MTTTVYLAVSLDGDIAPPDESLQWLDEIDAPDGEDFGYAEFLAPIDAIVLGRRTYEMVLGFSEWPYAKPVCVWSSTLDALDPAVAGKAELVSGPVDDLIDTLGSHGHTELYVDGGGAARSFLEADRLDRMILTRIPVLLGGGVPLFGALPRPLHWTHEDTRVYPPGLVKSTYLRDRARG